MTVTLKTQSTNRFLDPFPYVAFGGTVLLFLALIVAFFLPKTLVSTTVNVEPEDSQIIEDIRLTPQPVGALRIDVQSQILRNQWVTYEIQILDSEGEVLASAIKQAWKESGTWYEDGESGTWYEEDIGGGLDVQAKREETISIAIAVLEYGETSGRELDLVVPFRVTVKNGVVDTRYLFAGMVGTIALGIVAWIAVPLTGEKAIAKTINDSDPSDRATVGGSDKLVRVTVNVKADETTPRELHIRLSINNSYGEQVYSQSFPIQVNYKREEGKIESATVKLEKFLILEPQDSYGFSVEVTPDAPIDSTTLTVWNGNKTRGSVPVTYISPSPLQA
ncbi:MAG: hypothetical protein ACOC0N_09700 [Chroococcales cyanobacterium]